MLTLNQVLKRPLSVKRDFSSAPLSEVIKCLKADTGGSGDLTDHVSPDEEAILFYLRNHAMALVQKRVGRYGRMPEGLEKVADEYYRHASNQVRRLYYYCILIITRESRHVHHNGTWVNLSSEIDPKIYSFVNGLSGSGSDSAASKVKTSPPQVTIGQYVEGLSKVFHKGSFSGGYGGHKWGAIADCLLSYVTGTYSPEMFIDTAFTLCHNNGPIFNKGMLYENYSSSFTRILDIQRAGMIPNWLWGLDHGGSGLSYNPTSTVKGVYKEYQSILGGEFAGHVDWVQVQKHGVHNYSSQIAAQQAVVQPSTTTIGAPPPVKKGQSTYGLMGKEYPVYVRAPSGEFIGKVEGE